MSYKKFIGGGFHKFYITNTIPEVSNRLENVAPFEVIHIEDEIIESLDRSFQLENTFDTINHLNVYVASTNQVKMTTAYVALKEFLKMSDSTNASNVKVHVYGVGVPSEVPEQPVGTQTHDGCANRLSNLEEYVRYYKLPYDVLVSIENGVNLETVDGNDSTYDFSVVKIRSKKGEVMAQSEYRTYFPKEYFDSSVEQNQTVTVGNLIEKKLNIKSGTWHERFGSKTRETDLKETIYLALQDESLEIV
jgi:non-canonical (house-cleaning) NTP pyrophosphatase